MKTTTNTGRDILSNEDIAATCGDADCATSDAEMTDADRAVVAAVEAEVAATEKPAALTYEAFKALPEGTALISSSGKTYYKMRDLGTVASFGIYAMRNGERFGRRYGFRESFRLA